jgi:hypothetical protein
VGAQRGPSELKERREPTETVKGTASGELALSGETAELRERGELREHMRARASRFVVL